MNIKDRRDSFYGKMSVCNNLTQYGISFSLTIEEAEGMTARLSHKYTL